MEIETPGASEKTDSPYYTVTTLKLILLSIFTLGIFETIWFYKNWKVYRNKHNEDISPFWRAVFAGFTGFSFFERVKGEFAAQQLAFGYNPVALGLLLLFGNMLSRLPGFWFLLTYISIVPIVIVNNSLIQYNGHVYGTRSKDDRISILQWGIVIFGCCLLFFALVGIAAE
jgi:hypothetical protein